MQVDDTKDRVYIYDLDKELADAESDEERPIFIPDIEKHMLKIPHHVLMGQDAQKLAANQQLVLYKEPAALSLPENQDSVRKAVVEARARAREKALRDEEAKEGTKSAEIGNTQLENGFRAVNEGYGGAVLDDSMPTDDDPDAMEIE